MKITFPKKRKEVKLARDVMFVVFCKFRDGTWAPADFWGIPYSNRSYKGCVENKRLIVEKASGYRKPKRGVWSWRKEYFAVAKITL